MSSFNMMNGIPVNGNKALLVDLLRKEWGFDGVLISDYNAIREMIKHGYLETEKECACVAANHEIDMEMMSGTYIKYLPELVAEGCFYLLCQVAVGDRSVCILIMGRQFFHNF